MHSFKASAIIAGALFCLFFGAPVGAATNGRPVRIAANDNRMPAGTRSAGTLDLALDATSGMWYPDGDRRPGGKTLAFAERGHAPQIPGPLVRVPVGTRIRVQLRNTLDHTLVVHNLVDLPARADRPIALSPGSERTVMLRANAAGTYYYWATTVDHTLADRYAADANLSGAIVVDPPGRVAPDRIFVLSEWDDVYRPNGKHNFGYSVISINGRSWPATERLSYDVGDDVRWRIINVSGGTHPMHLHGFPFAVLARGNGLSVTPQRDTREVTEPVPSGGTSVLAWSPDRVGAWMFHCHIAWHVLGVRYGRIEHPGQILPSLPFANFHVPTAERTDVAATGAANTPIAAMAMSSMKGDEMPGMSGMIMAVTIHDRKHVALRTSPAAAPATRRLMLIAESAAAPAIAPAPDSPSVPQLRYRLEDGTTAAAGSNQAGAPPLILTQGVPVAITVKNELDEATSVHWHGVEVQDSYDDGGMLSSSGRRPPMIVPGGSFTAHFTPMQSGSFMYHTHMDDAFQVAGGLAGPLVVLPPGKTFDPATDHLVMLTSNHSAAEWGASVDVNGQLKPAPMTMTAGTPQRVRLFNLTLDEADIVAELQAADKTAVAPSWTLIARDGMALARPLVQSSVGVTVGATRDLMVRPASEGSFNVVIRNAPGGDVLATIPVTVKPPVTAASGTSRVAGLR